jgi:hypothetical protein
MVAAGAMLAALAVAAVVAPVNAGAEPVPGSRCRVFPASNIWNTRIDSLPVHEMSETWLRSADAGSTDLHPDFGPPSYGMPFDVVDAGHADVKLRFTYDDESDPGPYPFGASTPIEGGSDRHALIVQRGTCRLYELFAAAWNDGDPRTGAARSSIWIRTASAPKRGHRPTPPGCRSSPGWCAGTRSGPAASGMRSGSPCPARRTGTSGPRATRPAWMTPTVRRWALA